MRTLLVATLALVLAACGSGSLPVAPKARLVGEVVAGLDVRLVVSPANVRPHDAFDVRIVVANPTADTIRVTTSDSCLVLPRVLRYGKRVPMEGTSLGCFAAFTTRVYAPGAEDVITFRLRAEYYSQHERDVDGAPAPRGPYLVQAVFRTAGTPILGQSLEVH